jgi:hypothetical protein
MTKKEQTTMTFYALKRKEHMTDSKNKTLVQTHYSSFGTLA